MISKFGWIWAQITGRFWFRVSLYALGGTAAVFIAEFGAPFVPQWIVDSITEGAARELLTIIASSMLVVATFSLGTMVQAYAAAASLATPRATRILISDPKSQGVLSTFLGAFVFAMVGLVVQGFGYYNPAGDAVLLAASTLVVLLVIGTLFSWLDHLANMVRLGETIRKVELRVAEVIDGRRENPWLGGVAPAGHPATRWPITTRRTEYVQHVDVPKLQTIAERAGGYVAVACPPGVMADPSRPLAHTSWETSDEDRDAIHDAFSFDHERSFDQDPRYGLIVLCEIASRALSPGVNDPGTAISIIGAQQRLLTMWIQGDGPIDPPPCQRVSAPGLATGDLFDDAFGPLTRDAAPMVEVAARMMKALRALAAIGPPEYAGAARKIAGRSLRHASESLSLPEEYATLTEIAAAFGASRDT